jgi:hypothetical protein
MLRSRYPSGEAEVVETAAKIHGIEVRGRNFEGTASLFHKLQAD